MPGYHFANWERGYGDFHLVPDLGDAARRELARPKRALVLCDVHDEKTRRAGRGRAALDPARADRARARRWASRRRRPRELEYYLFRDSYRDAARKGYRDLEPVRLVPRGLPRAAGHAREELFNAAARRHLALSGVPVENSKGEWGLGQHELNVRYADALEMADRHVDLQAVPEGGRRDRWA